MEGEYFRYVHVEMELSSYPIVCLLIHVCKYRFGLRREIWEQLNDIFREVCESRGILIPRRF